MMLVERRGSVHRSGTKLKPHTTKTLKIDHHEQLSGRQATLPPPVKVAVGPGEQYYVQFADGRSWSATHIPALAQALGDSGIVQQVCMIWTACAL
jgi:hypothetical protein